MRPIVVPLIDDSDFAERDTEPPVSSSADTVPTFMLCVSAPGAAVELCQRLPATNALAACDEDFSEAPTLPGVQLRLRSL